MWGMHRAATHLMTLTLPVPQPISHPPICAQPINPLLSSPPLPSHPLPFPPLPSPPPLSRLIKLLTERKKLLEKLQSYRDKVAELKRQIAELKKASGTAEVGREVEQLISDKKDLQNKVCCVGRVCGWVHCVRVCAHACVCVCTCKHVCVCVPVSAEGVSLVCEIKRFTDYHGL